MNSIEVDFAAVDEGREDCPVWCVRQRRYNHVRYYTNGHDQPDDSLLDNTFLSSVMPRERGPCKRVQAAGVVVTHHRLLAHGQLPS
jgi:hypothetical protein